MFGFKKMNEKVPDMMLLDVNASLKNTKKKFNKHWIWITKNVCSYKHNVYRSGVSKFFMIGGTS
jgi:hypothetical protein